MAKKRRLKSRTRARQLSSDPKTTQHSSEDDFNAAQSRGQSSDDTSSEQATNTSPHTSFTSMVETDEEPSQIIADDDDDDDDDDEAGRILIDDNDVASIYPASSYPRVSSPHRAEMPYLGEAGQDGYDLAASTRSLWEQDLDYREIHGRRYCREYFMPNDEIEQMRMTLIHQVFLHVLDGQLSSTVIDNPTRVLDVGTGTGDWAIKYAETHPNCEVVGTDISAIAETHRVPMNVFFEIEDAEDWDRPPEHYDLIHLRCLEGSFQDWVALYENVHYSLKRGGWIEILDFDTSDNLVLFEQHAPAMYAVISDLHRASEKVGRQQGSSHLDPRLLIDSGFTDVRTIDHVIPITAAEETAGKIWLISCLDSFEAYGLRLLTQELGWDPDECKAACDSAAREMANMAKDPDMRKDLSVKLRILVGRKPLDAPLLGDLQSELMPSHILDETCEQSSELTETCEMRVPTPRGRPESPESPDAASIQAAAPVNLD
jgi:SAM-dependent methyltransferase